jgi:hypothetical protein
MTGLTALSVLLSLSVLMMDSYPDDMLAALSECGVRRSEVTIEWVDELQDDVVTIGTLDRRLPEVRLDCLVTATQQHPATYQFVSAELERRYHEAYERSPEAAAAEARMVQDARAQLAEKGLLERAPLYEPGSESVPAFLERVEVFAGFKPKSILSFSGGQVRISPKDPAAPLPFESFSTLLNVLTLAFPEKTGPQVVIIGEDAGG